MKIPVKYTISISAIFLLAYADDKVIFGTVPDQTYETNNSIALISEIQRNIVKEKMAEVEQTRNRDTLVLFDPISGGNYRGTSDEFFKQNKQNFDCIFIDGLHTYKQVKNDILNSIKVLNEDGVILVHDCLPTNFYQQAVPRCKMLWTGDVWKSIVELRTKDNINVCVCRIDMGVGIIKKRKNSKKLEFNCRDFSKLKYKEYYANYENFMRIISYEDVFSFLNA